MYKQKQMSWTNLGIYYYLTFDLKLSKDFSVEKMTYVSK